MRGYLLIYSPTSWTWYIEDLYINCLSLLYSKNMETHFFSCSNTLIFLWDLRYSGFIKTSEVNGSRKILYARNTILTTLKSWCLNNHNRTFTLSTCITKKWKTFCMVHSKRSTSKKMSFEWIYVVHYLSQALYAYFSEETLSIFYSSIIQSLF